MTRLRASLVILIVAIGGGAPRAPESSSEPRRPVSLAISRDGSRLFVANSGSGSLSSIDPTTGRVVSEVVVGRGLADVVTHPQPGWLIVADRPGDAVLLLDARQDDVRVIDRLPISPDPVRLAVSPDGSACAVSSLESRRVTVLELKGFEDAASPGWKAGPTIDLPFRPREMAWLPGGARLVVADGFGGRLALVDRKGEGKPKVVSVPGHNLRGLGISPDGKTLAVAHQVLHRLAHSSFEDVHWGSLVSNHVRLLKVERLLDPSDKPDVLEGSRLIDLGETGRAAGDPSGLCYDHQGRMVVTLAGVGEVVLGPDRAENPKRIGVGQGPSAVVMSRDGATAFVLNRFDETISCVDVTKGQVLRTIALGEKPEPGPVERGERLFHDARLSHDGWMSCQSCHTDGQSNGLLSDTLGDNAYRAPKRVTSLLGVGSTGPWTWTGSVDRLEEQVRKSVETTMQGRPPKPSQVDDLTAYLKTLAPLKSVPPSAEEAPAVGRGREVFRSKGCAECHAAPDYTAAGRFDVGLTDEVGNRRFNPPSLRGVGRREALLHDGRCTSLEDVFLRVKHPNDTFMTAKEVADLVAFLKTL